MQIIGVGMGFFDSELIFQSLWIYLLISIKYFLDIYLLILKLIFYIVLGVQDLQMEGIIFLDVYCWVWFYGIMFSYYEYVREM